MNENSSLSFEFSIKPESLQKIYDGFGKVILLILLTISFCLAMIRLLTIRYSPSKDATPH